jgi:acetolactate synthase-1/2/3 large subunit
MTGGEALVKSLAREGVRAVFGLPGVQLYAAIAALRDEPGIRFIVTRHEQATSYMADGYAKASGEFGTALVVPGPGLLNAAAGLSTAYAASSPVLMIAGQIPRAKIGKNIGLLHEVNDQLDAIAPVTKWRKRVLEVQEIPRAVRDALFQLKTGRPRPVEIEIPQDTLEEEGDVELLEATHPVRPAAPTRDLDRALEMLLAAANPLIYAGGGVHTSGAHEALAAVADYLQAGVIQSHEGKGAISDESDLSLTSALWPDSPLRACMNSADAILAVGTRLAGVPLQSEQQVIQIDIDEEEIGRNHAKTFGLVGDAKATLELLIERLRKTSTPRQARGVAGPDCGDGQSGAAVLNLEEPACRRSERNDPGARSHPNRVLLPPLLARVPPPDLSHPFVFRQPGLCVSGRARRKGCEARSSGGLDFR